MNSVIIRFITVYMFNSVIPSVNIYIYMYNVSKIIISYIQCIGKISRKGKYTFLSNFE